MLSLYPENLPLHLFIVWESEEWLQEHARPVGSGGVGSQNPGNTKQEGSAVPDEGEGADAEGAME